MTLLLFFLHLDITDFLILPILNGCTARVEWLFFSSSSIWTSSRVMRLFCFFLHFYFVYLLELLPIVSACTAPIEWLYFSELSIWRHRPFVFLVVTACTFRNHIVSIWRNVENSTRQNVVWATTTTRNCAHIKTSFKFDSISCILLTLITEPRTYLSISFTNP
jgi:hypothetical protein